MKSVLTSAFISVVSILMAQSPASDNAWNTAPPKFYDDFSLGLLNQWNTVAPGWDHGTDYEFLTQQVTIQGTKNKYVQLTANLDYHSTQYPFSSGWISPNTGTFKYGYFEAYMYLASYGDNFMPAFWMLAGGGTCGDPGSWYDEIDNEIYAHYSPQPFDYSTNFHWKRETCDEIQSLDVFTPTSPIASNWHKYGFEWTPDHVIYYYDDVPFRIKEDHIPDHDLTLIFSLEMRNGTNHYNNSFPGFILIDNVKIYNMDMSQCATTDISFSGPFNPSTYDYVVKRNITFLNGNSTNLMSGAVTLRASADVTINGDFTVQGADFTILPTACY
jgi:beta-glucanase (GH16 family)